ncbi:Wall-associated receptor kinase 2 [Citrus sinensis]|nr:Wall-associated receptor kinase 2 [Citrus sinensis]
MPFRLIMLVVRVQLLLLAMSCHCCTSRASTASAAHAQAKPGCLNRCGDVEIPYPFGTEPGCFLNEEFRITCNDTHFNPPKPFLWDSNIDVVNISIDGHLNVMQYTAKDCYDAKGYSIDSNLPSITLSKFTVSKTGNKFIVIGCDSYAYVSGFLGEDRYKSGCMCTCDSFDSVTNGSCVGTGCCQIEIPRGLKELEVEAVSFNNHTNVSSFNPCTYAFVVDQSQFHFTSNYLALGGIPDYFPMVLDWEITTNETCEEAKICGLNASWDTPKDNTSTSSGYRCKCNKGYEGNPYLSDGCQDINECEDPSLNNCTRTHICDNIPGSYTCRCRKGFHGDGRKDGGGCIPNQKNLIKVALGCGLGPLFLIGIWGLYKFTKKRREIKSKQTFFKRNGGLLLQQELSSNKSSVEKTKLFTSKDLEKATDNYNANRILGQGGQGTVYKGMLADGRIVAVKKSKLVDENNVEQFINEVVILSQINHRNIVKLLGCCLETEVPLLVYEFVPNGTLYQYIHNHIEEFPITWELLLRIAVEVSGALFYLHSAASISIYHRDIKSANILLDDKYRAKVSDFGTSRSITVDQTHLTTKVQGTFGYVDPEYFQSSQFTEKSDVYSFGVVLVEILTGQKPIRAINIDEDRSLVGYFLQAMNENRLFEVLDALVLKEAEREEIMTVATLAKRCLNLNGKNRPTMKEVAFELGGIRASIGASILQQNCGVIDCVNGDISEHYLESNLVSMGTSILNNSAAFSIDAGPAFSIDARPLL